jgi:hypothetical protein
LRRLPRQRNNFPWSRLRACRSSGGNRGSARRRYAGRCRMIARRSRYGRTGGRRRHGRLRGSGCCSRHSRTRRRGCYTTIRSLRFTLFLLLLNGTQDISRPGNVGQINLRLLFGRCSLCRRIGRGPSTTAQGGAHTPGLVFLYRTGVCFLLSDSHLWQDVENDSALNFQLSC